LKPLEDHLPQGYLNIPKFTVSCGTDAATAYGEGIIGHMSQHSTSLVHNRCHSAKSASDAVYVDICQMMHSRACLVTVFVVVVSSVLPWASALKFMRMSALEATEIYQSITGLPHLWSVPFLKLLPQSRLGYTSRQGPLFDVLDNSDVSKSPRASLSCDNRDSLKVQTGNYFRSQWRKIGTSSLLVRCVHQRLALTIGILASVNSDVRYEDACIRLRGHSPEHTWAQIVPRRKQGCWCRRWCYRENVKDLVIAPESCSKAMHRFRTFFSRAILNVEYQA